MTVDRGFRNIAALCIALFVLAVEAQVVAPQHGIRSEVRWIVGTVVGPGGAPLPYGRVSAYDAYGRWLASSRTNWRGEFQISLEVPTDDVRLFVDGYQTLSVRKLGDDSPKWDVAPLDNERVVVQVIVGSATRGPDPTPAPTPQVLPSATVAPPPSPTPTPFTRWHVVDVLYATDRDRMQGERPTERFGWQFSDDVSYGHCRVSIPPGHKSGNVERPWSVLTVKLVREDPNKHVTILEVTHSDRGGLLHDLTERLNAPADPSAPDGRDVLVFVHGFNVAFAAAARQTAQLAYDLGFHGVPFLYSWASKGTLTGYIADGEAVKLTVPHLRDIVQTLTSLPDVRRVHVIAHSMGNRALAESLATIPTAARPVVRAKLNQVVLAAPDIDARVFEKQIAPAIKDVAERTTLYASSNDDALKASAMLAKHRRAGDSRPSILTVDGVDSIDASAVNTGLGHFPAANVRTVIDDLAMLIREGLPPDRRNLLRHSPAPFWWAFKP